MIRREILKNEMRLNAVRMRRKKNRGPRMERCAAVWEKDPYAARGRWRERFREDCPLYLELGCGKGRFTVETAAACPDALFVAVERVPDALLLAMERAVERGLDNVVFVCDDAARLEEMFAPGEVDRMYINFCDPWPSKKHAKRRLTFEKFLLSYRNILSEGGAIEFKTDNRPLFDFSLTQFVRAGYRLTQVTNDLHRERPDVIMTDYEARFAAEGVKINRCVGEKLPAVPAPEGEPPKLSLLDYLPEELDHIPYGMEDIIAQNQTRIIGRTDAMTIRAAAPEDARALAEVEAACFPPAEAATAEEIAARLAVYPDRFWLLLDGEKLVGFVDGMASDDPHLRDEMYADAALHRPEGDWQMIFGVNTLPGYRRQGCAGRLLRRAVADTRAEGRKGLVLTCKEEMIHYYERFGFVNEGLSDSVHGGAEWYEMRLTF